MSTTTSPNDLLTPTLVHLDEGGFAPRDINNAVKRFAAAHWNLTTVGGKPHDAVDDRDTPVRIQGARWRVRNGTNTNGNQTYTHGRFRIDASKHEWLKAHNGTYAFIVFEDHDSGIVPVYARTLRPQDMDDWVLPDELWDSKTALADYRLAWPKVFPNAEGTI